MKFNKNTYGKSLLDKIMTTIKPKASNINLKQDPSNPNDIVFTNVNNETKQFNLDVVTDNNIGLTLTASHGALNPNPHMLLGELDYVNILNFYPNNASIVNEATNGSVGSLRWTGDNRYLTLDTILPYYKNMKYKISIDVKARWKDDINLSEGDFRIYTQLIPYDGTEVNTDYINRMNLGNPIYAENLFFRGTDENDVNTAYKYILTREFKQGDEYFYFRTDDINNWYIYLLSDGLPYYSYNSIKFHRPMDDGTFSYVGKGGKVFKHLEYSKDVLYGQILEQDTTKNADDPLRYFVPTGNTVEGQTEYKAKIKNYDNPPYMWRGEYDYYPVGSIGLQTRGSGYITYLSYKKVNIDNTWRHFESSWIDTTDKNGLTSFYYYRQGTAFCKINIVPLVSLSNTDKSPDDLEIFFTNIQLEYMNT